MSNAFSMHSGFPPFAMQNKRPIMAPISRSHHGANSSPVRTFRLVPHTGPIEGDDARAITRQIASEAASGDVWELRAASDVADMCFSLAAFRLKSPRRWHRRPASRRQMLSRRDFVSATGALSGCRWHGEIDEGSRRVSVFYRCILSLVSSVRGC